MKRYKIHFLRIALLLVLLIFISITAHYFVNRDKPPVEEIKLARESISNAKDRKANNFAKSKLNRSVELYDSAMVIWNLENEKFFLFRNYDMVRKYALEAAKLSGKASSEADSNSKFLKQQIKKEIDVLQLSVRGFHENFNSLPLDQQKRRYNKGKLLLGEARLSWENGNFSDARLKLNEAKILIKSSYDQANDQLKNFFNRSGQWKKWAGQTIEHSRENHSYAILVDKYARKCYLYQGGKVKETFEIELGNNWMGQKNHQGDQTTPEGMYKVISKKEKGKTKFYKALLINYPNEEDKNRFHLNRKSGKVDSRKSIGGLIEIHGNGGQGVDWTDGCVALTNKDMDLLYAKSSVGTLVTIVGSLKPLEEIVNAKK